MRWLLYISFLFVFASCSPEYYVERTFEHSIPEISLMLVFPEELHAVNSKSGLDMQTVSDQVYDSIFYASDFLPYIWRDTFLMDFERDLQNAFRSNGFQVYNDKQWSDFLSLEGPSYIVHFTYLQLEERFTTHTEVLPPLHNTSFIDKLTKPKVQKLKVNLNNTLTLNAWVDFQHVQDTARKTYSFYTYSQLSDTLESRAVEKNGEIVYQVYKDSLTLDKALGLKQKAPLEIRSNIVDFMVNQTMEQYIGVNFYRYPSYYLRFDGKGDLIKSSDDPEYIFLKAE